MAEQKTNVMRVLEQKKITYTPHSYPHGDDAVDGATVAQLIGKAPEQVYKTLVTVGASKNHYVFVIPVLAELNLKKAAKAVGEKSIAMLHVSELLVHHSHRESVSSRAGKATMPCNNPQARQGYTQG